MNKEEFENARKNIFLIDQKMIQLFIERFEEVKKVAEYKKENNVPVFDEKREKELLNKYLSQIPEQYKKYFLKYQESLFSLSKDYQASIIKK